MPFLHNQLLSRGQGGGTAGGVFTFAGAESPFFTAFVNDSSSHSLEFASVPPAVHDFAFWTATPSGSAVWDAGYTMELWCWIDPVTTDSTSAQYDNIFRMGDAVNNYGQGIGLFKRNNDTLGMAAWHTTVTGQGEERFLDNLVLLQDTWHHMCIERGPLQVVNGQNRMRFSFYLNGTQRFTSLQSATTYQSTPTAGSAVWSDTTVTMGQGAPGPAVGSSGFRGYINSARISYGVRYGATFTPSTELAKDDNCWFLVQLNNNFSTE